MRDPPVRTSEFRQKMVEDALEGFCRTLCHVCIPFNTTQYHQVVFRLHRIVGTYCSRHNEFGKNEWRINVIRIYTPIHSFKICTVWRGVYQRRYNTIKCLSDGLLNFKYKLNLLSLEQLIHKRHFLANKNKTSK